MGAAFQSGFPAGPRGACEYHARSASPDVANVAIDSPAPGQVRVTVLARDGTGEEAAPLLDMVQAACLPRTCARSAIRSSPVRPRSPAIRSPPNWTPPPRRGLVHGPQRHGGPMTLLPPNSSATERAIEAAADAPCRSWSAICGARKPAPQRCCPGWPGRCPSMIETPIGRKGSSAT